MRPVQKVAREEASYVVALVVERLHHVGGQTLAALVPAERALGRVLVLLRAVAAKEPTPRNKVLDSVQKVSGTAVVPL